jgi:hypothetical protein
MNDDVRAKYFLFAISTQRIALTLVSLNERGFLLKFHFIRILGGGSGTLLIFSDLSILPIIRRPRL